MPRLLLLLLASLCPLLAQGKFFDNNFHQWLVYSGDHRIHGRWGAHLEIQWRRHEFLEPQQLLPRAGLNYSLTPNAMLTGGYAWVSTHRYGDFPTAVPFPERRIWEQLAVNTRVKGNTLQHRFRFEQRWLGVRSALADGTRVDLGYRFQNRFRYQLRFIHDFDRPLYLAAYNEIFLNVAPVHGARIFDQNRVFAGGGIRLNGTNRLEMGYMQQSVLQRNGQIFELNHTLHVAIYSTLPFGD